MFRILKSWIFWIIDLWLITKFQPPQNENRSPSPVPANPLFKKCSVADMSSNIPGVSLFLRFRQDFHNLLFVILHSFLEKHIH